MQPLRDTDSRAPRYRDIARPRLLNRLLDPEVRIVRLVAAAGFGKSTLAQQLLQQNERCITCDFQDAATLQDVARTVSLACGPPQEFATAFSAVDSDSEMVAYAEEKWRAIDADLCIFENTERVATIARGTEFLESLLRQRPAKLRICICTRPGLKLSLTQAALPHEIAEIGEADLAFSSSELAAIFRGFDLDLEKVAVITAGWPLCVRLIAKLMEFRDPREVLSRLNTLDFNALYAYLFENVVEQFDSVTRDLTVALAGIGDATPADFARLYGEQASHMTALARAHPLVSERHGALVLHPLVRESIQRAFPSDVREALRIAAEKAAEDDRIRAAALFMRLGDAEAAAVALEPLALAFVHEPSDVHFSLVLQDLPRDILIAHPRLFSVAMLFNGLSLSSEQRLNDALEALSRLDRHADANTYQSIAATVTNVLGNLGRWDDAMAYINDFRDQPDPTSQLYYRALHAGILARRGKYEEALPSWDYLLEHAKEAPSTLAMLGNELAVHHARAHGDGLKERHWLNFTLAQARKSKNSTALALTLMEGIFSSYLQGDDQYFGLLSADLAELTVPAVMPGTRLFRACMTGNLENVSADVGRPQLHAYAYLIALGSADQVQREKIVALAISAADRSGEPYLQAVARVAAGFIFLDQSDRWFAEAAARAADVESKPLAGAITQLQSGAVPAMFAALERNIRAQASAPNTYRFSIFDQSLYHGNLRLSPTKREAELLAYLAFADRAVARDELSEALAPEAQSSDAERHIRVIVARIRKKFGERVIESTGRGYALGAVVESPLRDIRSRLKRVAAQTSPPGAELLALQRDQQVLEAWLAGRRPAFEWGHELDASMELLAANICACLAKHGAPTADTTTPR